MTQQHRGQIIHVSTFQSSCIVRSLKADQALEGDTTFSSIGATIADNFGVTLPEFGRSYLNELK